MDAELGLIYVRVPTWAPFRLQFYCNGHSWLARQLTAAGIGFVAGDNAFLRIDDWDSAQKLADGFSPEKLHHILDRYAAQCCPVLDVFKQRYHWSLMQVEYSTDIVFASKATLAALYEQLVRHSVLTVKAETIATFLGRKISPNLAQEIGSQFSTRIEGACLKHRFGKSSIKMYDKFGIILRIETTTNDVSSFKHYRKVEHRDGPATQGYAPMKKNIYSLRDLQGILFACNRRYLAHLSALDDVSAGLKLLDRVTRPRKIDGKTVKGIDFFNPTEQTLLRALQNPKFNIAGVRRADLALLLEKISPSALSRYIRRLRDLGLVKRVAKTYRYYLTSDGRRVIAAAFQVTEYAIIPALA
jgi:DNA-binding transcriptional ArsR family regulator